MGWWSSKLAGFVAAALACGGVGAQQAVLESFQQEQGLGNLAVLCIAQERRGALWICTENGLYRFDGSRFRNEMVPASPGTYISAAVPDARGNVWVATTAGLFLRRAVGAGAQWREVRGEGDVGLPVELGQRVSLSPEGDLFLATRDGSVWRVSPPAASVGVVARRVPLPPMEPWAGRVQAQSPPLRAVEGDTLWLGCGEALCEWRNGELRRWQEAQGVPRRAWSALLRSRDGTLWARSVDLLVRLRPEAQRFESVPAPAVRRWAEMPALVEDADGRILTTTDEGVAAFADGQWHHWTQRHGLPETATRSLLVDAQGSLWIGTSGRGLHRWVGWGRVEHWRPADGLPSPVVWNFARDASGRLWVGTSAGVAWYDSAARRFRPPELDRPYGNFVFDLLSDAEGNVWWTHRDEGRVMRVRPGSTRPEAVLDIAPRTYLARGTGESLYLVQGPQVDRLVRSGDRWQRRPVAAPLPSGGSVWNVVSDGLGDWFLSERRAYRLQGDAWELLQDQDGVPVELGDVAVFESPTSMWVADQTGLAKYELEGLRARRVAAVGTAALGHARPAFLERSPDGRLWVGSDQGVLVLDNGRWSRLDQSNGLLWNDVDSNAFLAEADGSVWIGTSAGATRVHPSWRAAPAPRLVLEELQFGERLLAAPPVEPVDWKDRGLRVAVATADLSRSGHSRIEYRLDGERGRWRELEGNALLVESLEPGAHELQLRAAGKFPAEPAGPSLLLSFTIAPPWWDSVPAKLAYALLGVGLWWLANLAVRRRATYRRIELERQVEERTAELEASRQALHALGEHNARSLEEERKRVARELHDEMGQQLAALKMEVSVLALQARAARAPEPGQLEELRGRVDRVVQSMREVVTQLRPPALDAGLRAAIDWLVAQFQRTSGLPCDVRVEPAADSLPPDTATMIFRVAQESLSNVSRHASATHASLRLAREAGDWVLQVRDDGVGFDPGQPRRGHGVLGMHERARLLGGDLLVDSQPGAGCTVRLRIPAPAAESGAA